VQEEAEDWSAAAVLLLEGCNRLARQEMSKVWLTLRLHSKPLINPHSMHAHLPVQPTDGQLLQFSVRNQLNDSVAGDLGCRHSILMQVHMSWFEAVDA
jgi:hypothetical protein